MSSHTIEAGNIWLTVDYRRFSGDEGYDIRVYARLNDQSRQILRFDCFKYQPHFHYDPLGRDERIELAGCDMSDALRWTLRQLSHHLPEMLTQAGFAEVAAQVQPESVREAVNKLEQQVMKALPRQ